MAQLKNESFWRHLHFGRGGAGKSSVNEKLYGNERKQIESGEEEANELKRILRLKEPESETERLWQDLVHGKEEDSSGIGQVNSTILVRWKQFRWMRSFKHYMKIVYLNANVLTLTELNAIAERIRIYVIRVLMHLVQISFAISFFFFCFFFGCTWATFSNIYTYTHILAYVCNAIAIS